MQKNSHPSIKFINHASIIIANEHIKLLSDPWYSGDVFHQGWSLIYENNEEDIFEILKTTTHIWISHEHPDHLSIPFFKTNRELLKSKNIQIMFQETKDKRVLNFIKSLDLDIIELKNEKEYFIEKNFSVKCVKFSFYDSALLINVDNKKVYNLNDCPLNNKKDLLTFKSNFGSCDVLLSQFSYAAWKGGKNNIIWRSRAANEKMQALINQAEILEAKTVIPFASFVKFSNTRNSYLNENRNTPNIILEKTKNTKLNVVFLKPNEEQNLESLNQNEEALKFWEEKISQSDTFDLKDYKNQYSIDELNISFLKYRKRIFDKNSKYFLYFVKLIPFIKAFKKIILKVENLEKCLVVDIFKNKIYFANHNDYDIELSSDSLNYILNNSFGFDTLTVNGCFEEGTEDGFKKMTKIFAIENLNNLGIYFNISLLFNFKIISMFFKLLKKVENNLKNN